MVFINLILEITLNYIDFAKKLISQIPNGFKRSFPDWGCASCFVHNPCFIVYKRFKQVGKCPCILIKRNMQMKRGESAKIQFVSLHLKIPSVERIFIIVAKFWLR